MRRLPPGLSVVRLGRGHRACGINRSVANLFLRYEGTEPNLPPVLVGSHIDTQPTGGKFDGAFGVLAALESVEAIIARGMRPRRSIEIVAWMNEEGSRFAPGMMGSAVFSGASKLEDILGIRDQGRHDGRIRVAQNSFVRNRGCRSARPE